MIIKPLVSLYFNVSLSETSAYINILKDFLEFKVTLAALMFPGYVHHYNIE